MNAVAFPDGLGDMLRDFVVAVLRQKPEDIYEFAADFFVYLRDKHHMKNVPMYIYVDDDNEACEPDPCLFQPKIKKTDNNTRAQRRHSIVAEKYDPEGDTEVQQTYEVYPKSEEQKDQIIQTLRCIILFRDFDLDQLQMIVDCMYSKQVETDEKITFNEDEADKFFVVETGIFDVYRMKGTEKELLYTCNNSGYFGEFSLMHDQPMAAWIITKMSGSLWILERKYFRELVMKIRVQKRKMYDTLIKSVPILNCLEENERMNLSDILRTITFEDKEQIIKQGDEADGMYFVESGLVRVMIKNGNYEAEVARISEGKYFGEMALLENKLRSASVYAVGSVKVAFLGKESFERLLGQCIDVMKRAITKYKS